MSGEKPVIEVPPELKEEEEDTLFMTITPEARRKMMEQWRKAEEEERRAAGVDENSLYPARTTSHAPPKYDGPETLMAHQLFCAHAGLPVRSVTLPPAPSLLEEDPK
jgi:hypothetical protein